MVRPRSTRTVQLGHLLSQDVDVVSHLPRRHLHLHVLTLALLMVGLLDHLHLHTHTHTASHRTDPALPTAGSGAGSGSDQLPRPQVEQDPLGVLAVVATLHQSQQQLGGVVLATR